MTTLNLDYLEDAAYYGDCADIMAAWKKAGVQGVTDLIYADPPFNSKPVFAAPTSTAEESDDASLLAYDDMWTYLPASDGASRVHPSRKLIACLKKLTA